jgi:hypothetical protein
MLTFSTFGNRSSYLTLHGYTVTWLSQPFFSRKDTPHDFASVKSHILIRERGFTQASVVLGL